MKTNELTDIIARKTGMPFSDVHLYARRLRESGFLPQGSRGKVAPDIAPEHAAHLIIALMATDIARQAPQRVATYMAASERLAATLADPEEAALFSEARITRGDDVATMSLKWNGEPKHSTDYTVHVMEGGGVWFELVSQTHAEPVKNRDTYLDVEAALRGDLIRTVAVALAAG